MNDTGLDPDMAAKIRRYLLAELDEHEAGQIEARYFSDAEFFARVDQAADALTDDFVRGALTAGESARIRELTAHPDWRQRVRIAEALRRELAVQPVEEMSPSEPLRFSIGDWFRSQAFGLRWGLAAAGLTLALGWPLLAVQLRQSRHHLAALQADMQARDAATRSDAAAAQAEANSLRSRVAALEGELSEQSTVPLILLPGMSRSEGDTFVVPKEANFVRFQLALERPAPSGVRPRALLRTVNRETVWSRDGIDPGKGSDGGASVTVPAVVLHPGQYELVLQAPGVGGTLEELAMFSFRIARR